MPTTETCTGHTPPGGAGIPWGECSGLAGQEIRTDILVVGSGPGGAMTATLLAENGQAVIMLEEGAWTSQESCIPFSRAEMIYKYRHGGLTAAMGSPPLAYVEGCCAGGGSEINSGLYHRSPPETLWRWSRENGVRHLTPETMEPHFAAVEQDIGVMLHPGTPPLNSLKLALGAKNLGWHAMEVPRWYSYLPIPVGSEKTAERPFLEQRNTMTRTLIPRFLRAGGTLLVRFRVEGVRFWNHAWEVTAVPTCSVPRPARKTFFARHLFLAAGAIGTPALLQRNKLAPLAGGRLATHPTLKVTARFPEQVNLPHTGVGVHQVKEFSPRMGFGCAVSSAPHLAISLLDHPRYLPLVEGQSEHLAVYYVMVRGEGRVVTHSSLRHPLPLWHMPETAWRDLAAGLRHLARLLFAAGADTLWPQVAGMEPLRHAGHLSRLPNKLPARNTRLMTIHLMGSCPMGEVGSDAVTDSFGRVHGQKNLYVCDASLLCDAPGVNPQGSVMALARRNVIHFLEQKQDKNK
ncbi:MAG: GMC family oxidoreductase [Magnetococcales bacterium]|nr:GMC family oxidoreductase [Magnetococcales bacterium]